MATNIPSYQSALSQLVAIIMKEKAAARKEGTATPEDLQLLDSYEALLADTDADPVVDPYRGAESPMMLRDQQEQALIQQIGTALYDLSVRQEEGATVSRRAVEEILMDLGVVAEARLFPFAYAVPYDLRRAAFELTSANGVWIPYQGLNPVAGTIDWNLVTSFDFLLRGGNGINYYDLFNAPAMKTFPRAMGIRQELPSGDANVVSFETTGPTVFPGVNAPPFISQAATILTGTGAVPLATQGANGDLFLRTDTGTLYVKVGGLWLPRLFELLATAGNVIHLVMAPPDAALGAEGDVAIVVATGRWWKKEMALWREQRGLKAPLNILQTPTYATMPVRRVTALDHGIPADIVPPIGTEYPVFLVLSSFTASGQAGMDGIGFEELRAVSAVKALDLQPSQLPRDARGYQTAVSVAGRLYRVAAVTDVGQGPFTDPVRVT